MMKTFHHVGTFMASGGSLVVWCGGDPARHDAGAMLFPILEPIRPLGRGIGVLLSEYTGLLPDFHASLSDPVRSWIIAGGIGIVLVAWIGYLMIQKTIRPMDVAALSLIALGGAGFLVDRFLHEGQLIELFDFRIGNFRADLFTLSEIALIAGIGLFVVSLLGKRRRRA